MVAHGFQRAVWQADLRFGNLKTLLGHFVSDVRIGDGAKQAAIDTGFLRQLDGGASELFAQGWRLRQVGSSCLFMFDALGRKRVV